MGKPPFSTSRKIQVFTYTPSGTLTYNTAAYATVDGSNTTFAYTSLATGLHYFVLDIRYYMDTGGDSAWQLSISGATTTTVTGNNNTWYTPWNFNGSHYRITLVASAILNAGVNNIAVQWYRASGSNLHMVPTADGISLSVISQ